MRTMQDMRLKDRRVLIREDFNVPLKEGKIIHTGRIDAALPTIKNALLQGAKVILMSHLGRPIEGQFDSAYSLAPVAAYLTTCLKQKVALVQLEQDLSFLQAGQVVLLENVRFLPGEEQNEPTLGKKLAALCGKEGIFVMDAFAVAHRTQASTCAVVEYAPHACAGPLLQKELHAINKILVNAQSPVLAIVGGAKVSTKLKLLNHLLDKVDVLVLGGGIANTFLAARGFPIGESLHEAELIPIAQQLWQKAESLPQKMIWLPKDVVVSESLTDPKVRIKACNRVSRTEKIGDIGPQACLDLSKYIQKAQTILWNGPVGMFEQVAFAQGTYNLAQFIAKSTAFSVAGGGDTLAAIERFQVTQKISYLSTGGGAFLAALEGAPLPAVVALQNHFSAASVGSTQ